MLGSVDHEQFSYVMKKGKNVTPFFLICPILIYFLLMQYAS